MPISKSTPEVHPGEFYSLQTGSKRFQVVRVIAVDEGGVHLTLFRFKFPSRPTLRDLEAVVKDADGQVFMPFRWFPFFAMGPRYLTEEPVTPRELIEYGVWQQEGEVYWGD
ncbi:MAG: hypothetical protein H6563_13765 [Lewinellaceae bacterium]|nr:hypothetical protein [Lewinellaceae bacterium]